MIQSKKIIRFIWKFVRPHKWAFIAICSVSFVWSLDATLWPYLLRNVIDILTEHDSTRELAWAALKMPVLCGVLLWITVELGFRAQGFLLASAVPRLEKDMRMAMFDHVQRHSPKYFNDRFAGSLANKITDMTSQVPILLQTLLTTFIPAVVTCILGLIFFSKINPIFAIVMGIWMVVHVSTCIFFVRKCEDLENIHSESRSALLGKIVDSLTNNFAVNLFYRFFHEKAHVAKFQKDEMGKNIEAKRSIEKMRIFLGLFVFLGAGVGIHGLMFHFWLKGSISTGEVAQIFNMTWTITMVLWFVSFSIPVFFQSIGIIKQSYTIMEDAQDVIDAPHAKPLQITKGEIVFEHVSFHYGEKKLFQDKDVQIRGGEKVGLVGFSGAGKSTFVNLVLRFFSVQTGRILIDGQDIAQVTLESLRQQVALIPQDPQLFHRSLKENIQYGRLDATEEEVIQAAKLAHCDEFIQKLPQGYDTLVGERGTKLSGGERQRIAIARAILAGAPILILDEATSSLDSITENYIQEGLQWLMEGRTSIVIAHRLSTLAGMDRILVFDQGKIVETGSHDELLARNGHYAKMWTMQAGGFLPEKASVPS